MRNRIYLMIGVLGIAMGAAAWAEEKPEESPFGKGDSLPPILLSAPSDPAHLAYLGLSGKKADEEFSITDIRAEILLIEIFSMYCPHCQRDAPAVNDLFSKLTADKDLTGRIKLIGIGVGNSVFEVDFFRKKYEVPFPLFPDANFIIHKQLKEVRTPYFIGVHMKKDGPVIFHAHLGCIADADVFLKSVMAESGMK